MKLKLLLLLVAIGAVSGAAWGVNRLNTTSAVDADGQPHFSAQSDGIASSPESEVPEKYRATATKGLAFLAKNQCADGHWEGDDGKHPVAMTGLVGIALIMERRADTRRNPRFKATHEANIHKAVDWLLQQAQPDRDGLIFSDHPSETARYMEGHGLATMFLAGVCECETNEERRIKLTEVLTRAVKYIARAQSTQGGWHHTSKVEGHDFDSISATVIQMQALRATDNAGIPIPERTRANGQEYLRAKMDVERSFLDMAAALAGHWSDHVPRCNRIDEMGKGWLARCRRKMSLGGKMNFGTDDLAHYYHAQAMYVGDPDWTANRGPVFDHLHSTQRKDGSWPSSNGISVGPVYATALWCTVLQLDNESFPGICRIPRARK